MSEEPCRQQHTYLHSLYCPMMSCLSLQLSVDQLPCKTGHIPTALSYCRHKPSQFQMTLGDQSCAKLHYTYILLEVCAQVGEKSQEKINAETLILSPAPTLCRTAHVFYRGNTDGARLSSPSLRFSMEWNSAPTV